MPAATAVCKSGGLPEFVTFVTTASYAHGVVGLAMSLLVFDDVPRSPVLVVYASSEAAGAITDMLLVTPGIAPSAIQLEPLPADDAYLQPDAGGSTHTGVGATLQFDAPRRLLFASGKPFIYLDCDLLCVSSPVPLLTAHFALLEAAVAAAGTADSTAGTAEPAAQQTLPAPPLLPSPPVLSAVPPFRLKEKKYGTGGGGGGGGGFNAGVMICCGCSPEDSALLDAALADAAGRKTLGSGSGAAADITEERVLSTVFKNRWLPLPPALNLIKRVWKHAPELWESIASPLQHLPSDKTTEVGAAASISASADFAAPSASDDCVGCGGGAEEESPRPCGGGGGGGDSSSSSSAVFVHYMGAKPWMLPPPPSVPAPLWLEPVTEGGEATRAGMDWDAGGHEELEELWWRVRTGQFSTGGEASVGCLEPAEVQPIDSNADLEAPAASNAEELEDELSTAGKRLQAAFQSLKPRAA